MFYQSLQTEADTKDGLLFREHFKHFHHDACILREAWSWRKYDGIHFFDFGDVNFIIPPNKEVLRKLLNVVHQVVGEGVVIIEDEYGQNV